MQLFLGKHSEIDHVPPGHEMPLPVSINITTSYPHESTTLCCSFFDNFLPSRFLSSVML